MLSKLATNSFKKTNFGAIAHIVPSFYDDKKDKKFYSQSTSIIDNGITTMQMVGGTTGIAAVAGVGWLATRYKVAGPNEYLVRTGIFIDDIDVSKQAFLLPYQTFGKINMEPTTYHCTVEEAMSHERISFNMPTVFTIGPKDDPDHLKKYAKLFQKTTAEDLRTKIIGVIQGEIRVAAGKIALDDLFNNRQQFKETLITSVDAELSQFGLMVYNANIEELRDMKGNEYFVFLRKRALEGAVNNAKVAVAEQNKLGNVGEKKHVTETRQATAEYEKQATVAENERNREIAESGTILEVAKAELGRKKAVAEAEAHAAAQKRELELQREVEEFKNLQQVASLRARDMSLANVTAEVKVRTSEGVANARIIEAEALAKAIKIEAEAKATALRIDADAKATATKMQADADSESMKLKAVARLVEQQNEAEAMKAKALAHLVEQQNEAEAMKAKALARLSEQENEAKGVYALRLAEANGLTSLIESAGGVENLNSYLMVRDGMITGIAKEQAEAVKGMNPSITVVQSDGKTNGLSSAVHDVLRTGIPLLESLKGSTGLDLLKPFKHNQA
jgi:flotillin